MFIFEILYNTNVAVSSVCSMNNVCSMQGFPCTWNRIEFQYIFSKYTHIFYSKYTEHTYTVKHTLDFPSVSTEDLTLALLFDQTARS